MTENNSDVQAENRQIRRVTRWVITLYVTEWFWVDNYRLDRTNMYRIVWAQLEFSKWLLGVPMKGNSVYRTWHKNCWRGPTEKAWSLHQCNTTCGTTRKTICHFRAINWPDMTTFVNLHGRQICTVRYMIN